MVVSTKIVTAQPFLKWVGGKGQLLEQFEAFFPQTSLRGYYEPFIGSGAVFFHLHAKGLFEHYRLSDINEELINCYRVVQQDVGALIDVLAEHKEKHNKHDKEHYYATRELDRETDWKNVSPVVRAARMIYLNKTCYNGLWRVNSKGQFNVPMGRYVKPAILDEDRLRAASAALQGVELVVDDFESVVRRAEKGDFVYFDPPYVPLSKTANFTSYAADDFGRWEQKKLWLVFSELAARGCHVMLSNSDTEFINNLYREFRVEKVTARRAINSASRKRGRITEVVVLP